MKYLKGFNESKFILSCSNPECDNTSISNDDSKCPVCGEDVIEKKLNTHEDFSGKALEFNPPIRDYDTLKKILDILVNLGFKHSDWPSSIEWNYDCIIGLYLNPHSSSIIWSDDGFEEENYQQHINDYVGNHIEILNGWDLL
jgi:hypothetical protein